jgi:phage portal protein BeeE
MKTQIIVDSNGNPFEFSTNGKRRVRHKAISTKQFTSDINQWFKALSSTSLPPLVRARDPFSNHPWVYAAAAATAIVASQAPFTIFQETDDTLDKRRRIAEKRGEKNWVPRRGKKRTALLRYPCTKSRLFAKGIEPDFDHPIMMLMENPNPFQDSNQLWQITDLWMAVRGECFWVGEMEDGGSVPIGTLPDKLWPLGPDLFEPIFEKGHFGDISGWWFCPPVYLTMRERGFRIPLPLTDVIQFKFPNPSIPYRGLSPLIATALSVELDLLGQEYNRSIFHNQGDPGGIITYDADLEAEEEREYLRRFEQRHAGSHNSRRTALFSGGFKYTPIAFSPTEMQWLEGGKRTREEVLGAMRVPPSVLGVTDFINYATQLGQDRNYWDKNILPLKRTEESTVDKTLLSSEPDNVVGIFDVKDIEALRSGTEDKVKIAKELSGSELHVPPKEAFGVVGLEVPEYDGDDEVLLSGTLQTGTSILREDNPPEDSDVPDSNVDDEEETESDPIPLPSPTPDTPASSGRAGEDTKERRVKIRRWEQFIEIQSPLESRMGSGYRRWIATERRLSLEDFDTFVNERNVKQIFVLPPDDAFGDIVDSQNRLKGKIRPVYKEVLESAYSFTAEEFGGMLTVEIDSRAILDFFEEREKILVLNTPAKVRNNLIRSLAEGISQGETVQQLRARVAEVYDISASNFKTLQIARTETAALMNGIRDKIFFEQGIKKEEWVTANDERVRDSHEIYGEAGPKPREFNYLTLTDSEGEGILAYPGDSRAPAHEVINCRCMKIAAG